MSEKENQNTKTLTVGRILKAARKAQGLSLGTISKKLCISQRHLKNFEEDDENLVCDVYSLGFLKSYAQFLGLDEKNLCVQFKEQAVQPSDLQLPFPAPLPGKGIPTLPILGFSIFSLIGLIVGWKWYSYSHSPDSLSKEQEWVETLQKPPAPPNPVMVSEEPPLEELPHVIPAAQEIQPVEAPALVTQPPSSPEAVILKVTEDAWIEVKDAEGNVIVSRLFTPEESYEFKTPQNLILKTGNARGTQLISGEKTLSFPESMGAVKSNISLNPEKWVDKTPEPQ